jgi:hypothetical protein
LTLPHRRERDAGRPREAAMPTTVPRDDDPGSLTDDMTQADLVEVLQRLPFPRLLHGRPPDSTQGTISLDRGVRDYLIAAIRGKR